MNNLSIDKDMHNWAVKTYNTKVYPNCEWTKAINKLRKKNKGDLIVFIEKILYRSYKDILPYPHQCCDYATDFAFMVFRELGYNVEIHRIMNEQIPEHVFLLLENEIIDFTNKQYDERYPIVVLDRNIFHYKDSKYHEQRNKAFENINHEWFAKQVRENDLVQIMNYRPFSFMIEKLLYSKKK